jgi:hypothetical protein
MLLLNNPTIQQSNNPTIQQSNNPTVQQSNNPTIQKIDVSSEKVQSDLFLSLTH